MNLASEPIKELQVAAGAPFILIREACKRFSAVGDREPFVALDSIDLHIRDGEFVALVGPSGCGKSTLLNLIAGLDLATSGEISIQGRPVTGELQPQVGYLFQRDALLPWKTVEGNVELPLRFRNVPQAERRQRVHEWLARVGLAGFERRYPHQLSGGMRKRAALAATFIYNPHILLMDEPFAALDVQTRNLMENELLELWQEHRKTVLFVTHDLEEAISLADRVVVLSANPARVKSVFEVPLARPRNVYEVRFEEAFRRLHEEIWESLRDEVSRSYAKQREGR